MRVRTLLLGMAAATAASYGQIGPAVAVEDAAEKTVSVRIKRDVSTVLVHVGDATRAVEWAAKIVKRDKLLALCPANNVELCIPIQLDRIKFENSDDGLFVDAAAIGRALPIQFQDDGKETSILARPAEFRREADDVDAYNASWGPGRGFRAGQTVPDIPLINLDGKEVRFSEFLGKRYIIYAWASW